MRGTTVPDEPHRAVNEGELQAARVPAAERVEVRPIVVDVVQRSIRPLVPVRRNGRRAAGAVGIGPGAVGVQGRKQGRSKYGAKRPKEAAPAKK